MRDLDRDILILIYRAAGEVIEELWLSGEHDAADTAASEWKLVSDTN